jgi:hypothetical protein
MQFSDFITEQKNTHMTHIEDKVLYGGVKGTRDAILALRSLREMVLLLFFAAPIHETESSLSQRKESLQSLQRSTNQMQTLMPIPVETLTLN